MRILYIMASMNPGGAEIQNVRVAIELRKRGHKIRFLCPAGPGKMEGSLEFWVRKHAGLDDLVDVDPVQQLAAMTDYIERLQPDVVITNGWPWTLFASIASASASHKVGYKIPCVITWANTGYVSKMFYQDPNFVEVALDEASQMVCNSIAVFDSLAQYPGGRSVPANIIYNGVRIPDLTINMHLMSKEYFDLDPDWLNIIYLANLRPEKNQQFAVRVMDLVRQLKIRARLYFVGNKFPYQREVERDVDRLRLRDYVKFPGRIDDLDLIAGMDLMLNTSTTEGFANALQEGMAYGLPIIASRVGGTKELEIMANYGTIPLIGHNQRLAQLPPDDRGFVRVFESNDLTGAAERIVQAYAIRDGFLIQGGKNNRRIASELFDLDKVVPGWEIMLSELTAPVKKA